MKALITGINGQTGSYMADLLHSKGWEVHGIIRRSSVFNTSRLDPIDRFHLYQGDVTDAARMFTLIHQIRPDHLYHFAAQSHVKSGFDQPLYTQETIVDGTLHLLEALRHVSPGTRFYFAGSSEMYGNSYPDFKPVSPYGAAKLYGYHLCELYKKAYGLWIVAGILFNHESPRRSPTFVSRKITYGLAQIVKRKAKELVLGNLNAYRDWGYAPEYCEAIFELMGQDSPRNASIGTGESFSVMDFLAECLKIANLPASVVRIDDRYKRPFELDRLCANPKDYEHLVWRPKIKFSDLTRIMMEADLLDKKEEIT